MQENPELVGFNPSGGYAKPGDNLGPITNTGLKTKAVQIAGSRLLEITACAKDLHRTMGKPLAECLAIAERCHPEMVEPA